MAAVTFAWSILVAIGGLLEPRFLDVRIAPATAVLGALVALAWTIGMNTRTAQAVLGVVLTIGWLSMVGEAFDLSSLRRLGPFGALPLQAAAAMSALAIGGLFAAPTSIVRRLFAGREPTNLVLRRLALPAAALLPVLAFIARTGIDHGNWNGREALAFAAIAGWALFLLLCAWVIAGAFRLQRRREEAAQRFEVDPLTGAGNRFALERVFARVFHDPARLPDGALLAVDVDDFRAVRAHVGPDAADRILCELAARIRHSIRPGDLLARTGDDEFVIYVDGIDPMHAMTVARNVTSAVGEWRLDHPGYPSVSIGVATIDAGVRGPQDLQRHAELALRMAKGAGKAVAVRYRPGPEMITLSSAGQGDAATGAA